MNETLKIVDFENAEKQRQMNIMQKNNFVQKARSELTLYQLKLLDFIMSKIQKEDTEFTMIHTNFLELMTVLDLPRGGTTYKTLANDLLALKSKGFYVLTDKGKSITATSWLGYIRIHDNGNIDLRLDEFLAPYLLQLAFQEGNFTVYPLADVVKLKSKYSIMMYKLVQSHRFKSPDGKKPILSMTAGETAEYFGQIDWPFYRIKEKILLVAQKELDSKGLYKLKYTFKKQGRKIVGVDIYAVKMNDQTYQRPLKKAENATTKKMKVPLHNWLE